MCDKWDEFGATSLGWNAMIRASQKMAVYLRLFPHLSQEYIPPDKSLRMNFLFGTEFPYDLVGTVKMVAYIDDQYLAIRAPSGWWEPGRKSEPGETYLETIRREMLEETGCRALVLK